MGPDGARDIARIAEHVRPMLPEDRRMVVDHALSRALTGRVRVLVLGEAKRGKSTLVNALFERDLLPTGALPVTSVATTVTVGSPLHAEVRYLDGALRPVGLHEVTGLVSERGNPSNIQRVDTVRITAPSPHLPVGTEVVDTPGTGSVHRANTAESARARASVDLAVLVVAADPPVSAAELALAADVMTTAAAAAVVVNKIDLVRSDDLAEIVEFTRAAVAEPLGEGGPVFPLSLRAAAPTELIAWLRERIDQHGAQDVTSSTARTLRREASTVLDGLLVEHELLTSAAQDRADVVATLRDILDHARAAQTTARDHVHGQARRARTRLDADHDREVAAALTAARDGLGSQLPSPPRRPEDAAQVVREQLGAMTARRCATWFQRAGAELDTELRAAAQRALADLAGDLAKARQAAARALHVHLGEVDELVPAEAARLPNVDIGQEDVWRELVTSTLAGRLPAAVRRKRLHRHLRDWVDSAVPRPFGRARSALQRWLDDTTRATERALANTWHEQLAALETGLHEASRHRSDTEEALAARRAGLGEHIAVLGQAIADLDRLIAEINGSPSPDPGRGRARPWDARSSVSSPSTAPSLGGSAGVHGDGWP